MIPNHTNSSFKIDGTKTTTKTTRGTGSEYKSILAAVVILSFAGTACATIQETELPTEMSREALPILRRQVSERTIFNKARDFKLRERTVPGYRLVLRRDFRKAEKKDEILNIAQNMLLNRLRAKDVQLIEPPEELRGLPKFPEDEKIWSFLKKHQADAVLELILKKDELTNKKRDDAERVNREMSFSIRLRDPVSGAIIAEKTARAEAYTRGIDNRHQVDIKVTSAGLAFMPQRSESTVRLMAGDKKSFRSILRRTKRGTLIVYAGSPHAAIFLFRKGRRERIGRASANRSLLEGKYRIEIRRRGERPIRKDVLIRAGTASRIFAQPEDISGVAIFTAPENLRLAQDGVIRGRTPIYLGAMGKGVYGLEISRVNEKGRYEIVDMADLKVAEGKNERRAFFINYKENFDVTLLDKNYWNLSSEAGSVQYAPRKGLGLKTRTKLKVWQGLVSLDFFLNRMRMELDLIQEKGTALMFGVMTPGRSALVQLESGRYVVRRYDGKQSIAAKTAYIPLDKGKNHKIGFSYDGKSSNLRITLDGDTIFSGSWGMSSPAKIVILSRPSSADGRTLARGLIIRSGRGVYDQ